MFQVRLHGYEHLPERSVRMRRARTAEHLRIYQQGPQQGRGEEETIVNELCKYVARQRDDSYPSIINFIDHLLSAGRTLLY